MKSREDKEKPQKTYWRRGIVALVAAFLFPLALCIVLKFFAKMPGQLLVVSEDIKDWFAFYGSYAGTFVAIVLGIITLRLTAKLDKINQGYTILQNRLSIVTNMPNMNCDLINLYSIDCGDFPNEYLKLFSKKKNHILSFSAAPAFPPYFGIEITHLEIALHTLMNDREQREIRTHTKLCAEDYHFTNNHDFKLVINVPGEMDEVLQMLYVKHLATTASTKIESIISDMWIDFSCHNVLLRDAACDVNFKMHFQLKNVGRNQENKGIAIEVINREFVCIE